MSRSLGGLVAGCWRGRVGSTGTRRREECRGRWAGLLQGLERTCREFWDPAEVQVTGLMAELGLE